MFSDLAASAGPEPRRQVVLWARRHRNIGVTQGGLQGYGDVSGHHMVGQRGPIWFLAGNATKRSCSAPEDKVLFFPVINSVNISIPLGVCGSTGLETAAQLRADIKPIIDAAQNLQVTVDDKLLPKSSIQRVQSQVFDVAFPSDNLFGGGPTCPAAIYSPAVDDGYYVALGSLKSGNHTIHFHGEDLQGTMGQS